MIYRIDEIQGMGYYIRSGFGIDRVVGVPGDRVQVTGGQLLINESPPHSGEGPLGRLPALDGLDIELGSRDYAIFPTLLRRDFFLDGQRRLPPGLARRLSVAEYERILGRAILRVHPLSRFGRIE